MFTIPSTSTVLATSLTNAAAFSRASGDASCPWCIFARNDSRCLFVKLRTQV
ncbi:hypothetical protein PR003_g7431 [Phytophthora rubi]|uniref:Uncharacterized protein n=1 Tax=Phytophthora rubi TaxID=129364 RepID=A0A6A3MZ65_9STRA|nr:hypothetical protein PR002_g7332 [Phytophthora rubi]KAE9038498.1 hypothetical protein PR001_g7930 [Phytophthora rubi]KAE9346429.1 hypothetical protein PR003_g7431 [Phytophthora rubi]